MKIILNILILMVVVNLYSQTILFQKRFGNVYTDIGKIAFQDKDGGYIIAGNSDKFGENKDDIWCLKLKKDFKKDWDEVYGSDNNDWVSDITFPYKGKGYIIAGTTEKDDNNLDFGIIRVDDMGINQWAKTIGGDENDECYSILSLDNDEYLLAGYTESFGAGKKDVWVVAMNKEGSRVWGKTYGGGEDDVSYKIIPAGDNGFLLCGYTESFGAGGKDVWIVKLDKYRNKVWTKKYGAERDDVGFSALFCKPDKYIIVGYTESSGSGKKDILVIKIDKNGDKIWEKTFGGNEDDVASSAILDDNENILISGYTKSYGNGNKDIYVLKLEKDGNKIWDKTIGGNYNDEAYNIKLLDNGSYLVAGYTEETKDEKDFFIVNIK